MRNALTDSEERAWSIVVLENDRSGASEKLNRFGFVDAVFDWLWLRRRRRVFLLTIFVSEWLFLVLRGRRRCHFDASRFASNPHNATILYEKQICQWSTTTKPSYIDCSTLLSNLAFYFFSFPNLFLSSFP